jgi:ATP-binding cassette subfamily C protein
VFDTVRKMLGLLTRRERWRWALQSPLLVLGAAMEAVGAAAVFMLIRLVADPSDFAATPLGAALTRRLPHDGPAAPIMAAAAAVAGFYVAKNALLAATAAIHSRILITSVANLSRRLLRGYMAAPLPFHIRRNSAELIRNCADASEAVFRMVLGPAVALVSEILVALGIIVVLLFTAPASTLLAVAILAVLLTTALRLTRRTVHRWGEDEQESRRQMLQTLQHSLGGLKEVRLLGREPFFYQQFARQQGTIIAIRTWHATLSEASRLLIETVFVCGMLLVIALVMAREGTPADVMPVLGLFAYAGFRIIPSVNRILWHLNNIRFGRAAVDRLSGDLAAIGPDLRAASNGAADVPMTFDHELSLRNVTLTYAGSRTPALREVSLRITPGESIGIVGPTGAGKSTLVDIILGFLQPAMGTVTVDGHDIFRSTTTWQRRIGYVPQTIFLSDDSLRRNVALGRADQEIDEQRVHTALRLAQLEEFVAALPDGLDTVVGERGVRLSGGERQRVAIARALYHEPQLLVFDEATSALDTETERELGRAIEALHGQKTLIIIAHRLSTVRNCDRLIFLREGRIAGIGSFDQLLAGNREFRRLATEPAPAE